MSYAWAPDSRTIAVGGAGAKTNELLSVSVRTGAATRIAPPSEYTEYVALGYSPDGRQLAVARLSGNAGTASCCTSSLLVEHPDGAARRRLFSFADPIHDGPGDATWSPDGRLLAFTDDGMSSRDPRFGIVDVAAAAVRRVAGFDPADDPPIWSPDGTRLTVVRVIPEPPTVYTFDLATGALTRIGRGQVPIAWYRDGTILATGEKDNILYALRASGGKQRPVFTLPKPLQFLTIEPQP